MDKEKQKVLLEIARKAIAEELTGKKLIDREALLREYPWLAEPGAAFVTLNENHQLRGCIGSIVAHQPLIDDLIHNAKAAAFNDPRFRPVRPEEYDKLEIEISLLTPPQEIPYTDKADLRRKIRPGVDGVILRLGNYQATYLPSVWEQLPDFDLFFATLC
ncbi:AmmeMemoRadiSam system protein A, partial [Nitratifractor sp.]